MKYDEDDAPELTKEVMNHAKRGREVLPAEVLAQFGKKRGRPPVASPKKQVSIRLDQEVLTALQASGDGWQSRANDALRAAFVTPRQTAGS